MPAFLPKEVLRWNFLKVEMVKKKKDLLQLTVIQFISLTNRHTI